MRPQGFNDYGLDDFSRDSDKLRIETDNVPPYLHRGSEHESCNVRGVPSECFFNRPNSECARTQRLGISRFPLKIARRLFPSKKKVNTSN